MKDRMEAALTVFSEYRGVVGPIAHSVHRLICRDAGVGVDDLAQVGLIAVWLECVKGHAYIPKMKSPAGFLATVAYRRMLDYIRTLVGRHGETRLDTVSVDDEDEHIHLPVEDPGFEYLRTRSVLRTVLSTREADYIIRHVLNGDTQREIGEDSGCSESRVGQVISGALTKLKAKLKESG